MSTIGKQICSYIVDESRLIECNYYTCHGQKMIEVVGRVAILSETTTGFLLQT